MSVPALDDLGLIIQRAGLIAVAERKQLSPELKPDGSIVTNADRKTEEFLRPELQNLLAGSEVWGEEFGMPDSLPNDLWLVDPIDGTTNFAHGSRLWGVSIGLMQNRQMVLGAIYLPDLEELYLASGSEATLNGKVLPQVRPGPIEASDPVVVAETFIRRACVLQCGKHRNTGAFVTDATMTAKQNFRALVGWREKLYDIAASLVIARAVGLEIEMIESKEPFDESKWLHGKCNEAPWTMRPKGASVGFNRYLTTD